MDDVKLDSGAIREVTALVAKTAQPITTEAVHAVIVPRDCDLKSLAEFQFPDGRPATRVKATVALRDGDSFIKYLKTFRTSLTRIFAEPKTLLFLAVLDYHGEAAEPSVEFLSHRVTFAMEKDERWNIWAGKNENPFTQTEFAEFIEDNAADIFDPSAANMLEIARDLQAHTEVNFASKVKLTNGQVQLSYQETVTAGVGPAGTVEIPEVFKIQIPVFYGEGVVAITCRLRYRISGGKLSFHYKMYRQSETLQVAFDKAVKSISESLGADILMGTPS